MVDYLDRFKFNADYVGSTEEKVYMDALGEYYNVNTICPVTGNNKIKKERKDNILIVSCKESGWYLKITLPKEINLFTELINIKNKEKALLHRLSKLLLSDNISNIKKEFIEIKEKYNENKNNIYQINEIFSLQKKKIDDLKMTINDQRFEMGTLYYKRIEMYHQIEDKDLSKKNKDIILLFLKENSDNNININDKNIGKLNQTIKIDFDELKRWIKWIKYCVRYLYIKFKYNRNLKDLYDHQNKYDTINNNFFVSDPLVDQHKKIKINKKGGYIIDNQNSMQGGSIFDSPFDSVNEHTSTIHDSPPIQNDTVADLQKQIIQEETSSQLTMEHKPPSKSTEPIKIEQDVNSSPNTLEKKVVIPVSHISQAHKNQSGINPKPILSTPNLNVSVQTRKVENTPKVTQEGGNIIRKQISSHPLRMNQIHVNTLPLTHHKTIETPNDNIKIIRIKPSDLYGVDKNKMEVN